MTEAAAPPPNLPWRYEASARGPRAYLVVGLWWGAVVLGLVFIDLNPWIAGVLLAFTLPALYEMGRGSAAWIEVAPDALSWGSGRREGRVEMSEIDRVRFDTRLDFSVRLTVVLTSGKKIRLPYECLPRAARLKPVLDAVNLPHEHHHFSLMG